MKKTERIERNAAICALYRSGASLREAGARFGLTVEGARQVLKRCGEPIRDKISATKANWQDPEFRARNAAAVKANWQDPEFRAKHAAATKANWQDPEFRAKQAAATKASFARKLDWCPPDLIGDYRLLVRHIGAAEARAAIEAQIAKRETA